jgi:hypothetical protein
MSLRCPESYVGMRAWSGRLRLTAYKGPLSCSHHTIIESCSGPKESCPGLVWLRLPINKVEVLSLRGKSVPCTESGTRLTVEWHNRVTAKAQNATACLLRLQNVPCALTNSGIRPSYPKSISDEDFAAISPGSALTPLESSSDLMC